MLSILRVSDQILPQPPPSAIHDKAREKMQIASTHLLSNLNTNVKSENFTTISNLPRFCSTILAKQLKHCKLNSSFLENVWMSLHWISHFNEKYHKQTFQSR